MRSLTPPGRGGQGIDKQKRAEDVSKDVSSFLNSDGGVLIYGVPETTDPSSTGGAPIPLARSTDIGFTPEDKVAKETIENLITAVAFPPCWASGRATTYELANELGILPPLDAGSDKGNLTRKHYAAGEDELHGLLDSEVCLQDFSLWYEG